jgi:nucleotide-binding universal stress UspA family protein
MRPLEIKRILVLTDLSPQTIGALQYARFFAERFSATLTLLNVAPIVFSVEDAATNVQLYVATQPDHIAALQNEVRAHGDTALQGFPYSIATDIGDLVPVIVEKEKRLAADLVVMATHGLRGWCRLILGSVTERVIRAGDVPVLSISRNETRPRTSDPIKRILCPINFSEVARASVEYASQLAAAFDGELVVVHVVEEEGRGLTPARIPDVREWIVPAVQNRCTYREIVLRGGAAERVLDCAEDIGADLLIIGAQH